MSSLKAITNMNLFAKRGANIEDFYRIFKIPFPNGLEMDDVIEDFIDAFKGYGDFTEFLYKNYENGLWGYVNSGDPVNEDNILQERYALFTYFSADVFGNLATSIKLAGEGYISESLAILRSVIDILFSSLFGSISEIISIETMSSPYYHQLDEISLDDLVINRIGFGDEEEGLFLSDMVNKVASKCLDNYLTELQANKEVMAVEDLNRYKRIIRDSLMRVSAESMNKYGGEFYKSVKNETTDPMNFIQFIMSDDRYVYRSCKEHERNLLERLQKQLEIAGDFDELSEEIKNGLKQLTFPFDISKEAEGKLPICDDCDNSPVKWSIHVRFDKRSMLKYLKGHLDKDALIKINDCTKQAFKRKNNDFFGDVIDRKIYNKLNPYSHGDPKDEPSVYEWYSEYMKPFLESLSCIYRNLIKTSETKDVEDGV